MKRKYLITGLVIGLQLVSGYSYESDASWLSKTWDRLETNAAKQSYDWPKAEQYRHYSIAPLSNPIRNRCTISKSFVIFRYFTSFVSIFITISSFLNIL